MEYFLPAKHNNKETTLLIYVVQCSPEMNVSRRSIRSSYKLRAIVKFMVACSPNPGLVGGTLLDEPGPRVPSHVVMERIIVCIRKIANVEHGLALWVGYIMLERSIGVICLSQVPCIHTELLSSV